MTEDDQLAAAGEFGDKVTAFLESEIGKYLRERAAIDEEDAKEGFITLDPWEYTELAALQNAIAKLQEEAIMARKNLAYLADAIKNGQDADSVLMSREDTSYE